MQPRPQQVPTLAGPCAQARALRRRCATHISPSNRCTSSNLHPGKKRVFCNPATRAGRPDICWRWRCRAQHSFNPHHHQFSSSSTTSQPHACCRHGVASPLAELAEAYRLPAQLYFQQRDMVGAHLAPLHGGAGRRRGGQAGHACAAGEALGAQTPSSTRAAALQALCTVFSCCELPTTVVASCGLPLPGTAHPSCPRRPAPSRRPTGKLLPGCPSCRSPGSTA